MLGRPKISAALYVQPKSALLPNTCASMSAVSAVRGPIVAEFIDVPTRHTHGLREGALRQPEWLPEFLDQDFADGRRLALSDEHESPSPVGVIVRAPSPIHGRCPWRLGYQLLNRPSVGGYSWLNEVPLGEETQEYEVAISMACTSCQLRVTFHSAAPFRTSPTLIFQGPLAA